MPPVVPPDAETIDKLSSALGQAALVAYAPPNIYPMSAPRFQQNKQAERVVKDLPELGIYAHVPFCNYKCSFCFYATRITPEKDQMVTYVQALEKELGAIQSGTRLKQLYVGGGTPTALPADLLDRLLNAIMAPMSQTDREIHTVECSPESITDAHVAALKKHGIKRTSMGVQTTQEGVLDAIGRRHAADKPVKTIVRLVDAGLMVNTDLIYGLPGQSEADFRRDFEAVVQSGAHSITAYNLRVNENTPVRRKLQTHERLDLHRLVAWRAFVRNLADELGFQQTRWHTFVRTQAATAKEAVERFRDVTGHGNQYGVGISARSRLHDTVYRNHSQYNTYLERVEAGASPVEQSYAFSDVEKKLRHLTLTIGDGLPLNKGDYEAAFGEPLDTVFSPALDPLMAHGLLTENGDQIEMTDTGKLFYDLVMRAFYPQSIREWMKARQPAA